MRIRYFLLLCLVVPLLLVWASGSTSLAARTQDTEAPSTGSSNRSSTQNQAAISTNQHNREKQKRWSGNLVDANCMAKVMSGAATATDQDSSRPDAGSRQRELPEPMPENPPPQPDRSASPRMEPGQSRQTGALPPGQNPDQNPDISQAQAAEMARANKVDDEAKQCVASAETTVFGLVLPGGQVVRFDDEGNAKTGKALKTVTVEPGKRVKAKVTGTLEGGETVKVSSVEIKGKRLSRASTTQGGG